MTTDERALELIEQLARNFGMSMYAVAKVARALMVSEMDPIEATGGEFVFQAHRSRDPKVDPRGLEIDWFNVEIPEPDARVDVLEAMDEFRHDCACWERLLKDYERSPTIDGIELLSQISRCRLAWCRFFAVRHHKKAMRETFADIATKLEVAMKENAEKAKRHLDRWRERGVVQMKGNS